MYSVTTENIMNPDIVYNHSLSKSVR